jgi:phenylalanyl-tRNA synthetase beta chain
MTISYNWLCEYLPERPDPEKLSAILTSIGLEVESLEKYEEIRGGLEGLLVGEVLTCAKHPDADKLSVTTVTIGNGKTLNIVCGAPNVATGQKVIVAPVGSTIYPVGGEPVIMKKARIRGIESEGMICAEDEIGLGSGHDGILILDPAIPAGQPAALLYKPYQDHIYEIGLTPNRMDAMSHLGVARDVCAWMSHHQHTDVKPLIPFDQDPVPTGHAPEISVNIENTTDCRRYSGILIKGITVQESPLWLRQKLKSIGLKPISNIVDITNFILHETGQPLHAFDADKITGNEVIVKNLPEGTPFVTLDDKERKLSASDLMICNSAEPMCIAGVYGGKHSGVNDLTKNIFLESAWFSPGSIRKTSLHHDLRTDAATRFEKGADISQTTAVLMRAARLVLELAGGSIQGSLVDVYPSPLPKPTVTLRYDYLKKLSGKRYAPDQVKRILGSLGFSQTADSADSVTLEVPYNKSDISIPADIVEEIMRIDGLDQVEIPATISLSPSPDKEGARTARIERLAQYLTGLGFQEIFTNSISNSAFYSPEVLASSVKMINSLSAELDMMRPQMLPGGLQSISYNLNRKNDNLLFFEYGKTYAIKQEGGFEEIPHLAIYATGHTNDTHWKHKPSRADFYFIKGAVEKILQSCGIRAWKLEPVQDEQLDHGVQVIAAKKILGRFGEVNRKTLQAFDIKQPVFYADLSVDALVGQSVNGLKYREIPRYPAVNRDLALVVDKNVSYSDLEKIALSSGIGQLISVGLFDIFESEKLGQQKKSMALSFVFLDENKTLTDKEIDGFMQKLIGSYEKHVQAEIRK